MKFLIDTTVLINAAKNKDEAVKFLSLLPKITTSGVCACELLQGAGSKREQKTILSFLNSASIIEVEEKICEFARELIIKYSLSHGMLILDALIAATAVKRNFILVTDNVKHFKFISELTVIKPNEAINKLS